MNKNDTNDLKDVIVLANDEIVVESFAGFEIVEPAGKGYFTITNKRLIYHATYRENFHPQLLSANARLKMSESFPVNSEEGRTNCREQSA